MVATQGSENASCTLCQRYGLQIITARNEASDLVGRATRAEARLGGRRSAQVDALRAEAPHLKDQARISERWLAEHRAEAHGRVLVAA